MGKVGFAHVEDGSGQAAGLRATRMWWARSVYDLLFKRLLDLGDFIAVSGRMVRTKTGEVSVRGAADPAAGSRDLRADAGQVARGEGCGD
jgi:lysyl-tRNA synthetase class II